MATATAPTTTRQALLERVTCPHCWEVFPPERILWVSEHNELLDDPLLGRDEQQRFLPTRFNVDGDALDAKQFPCHALACPRCHLGIPRPLLELEPLFMSIFGAPGSGKSFLLASMTWQLRQIMGAKFLMSFSDADPVLNRQLNEYEDALFLNAKPNELFPLAGLIRKTEEQGELYDTVAYGSQTVQYPRPFLFTMQPQTGHPNAGDPARTGRVVCLYDNAGESFQPGKDVVGSPVTRHMAHSRALFFVFDPTQDNRFRDRMSDTSAATVPDAMRQSRQEPVLQEAAARIRRHAKLRQTEKHNRPLIVILTKYDLWMHLLEPLLSDEIDGEPWKPVAKSLHAGAPLHAIDVPRIERMSQVLRTLLLRLCPEVVAAAESFAREVVFLPSSAVGWSAEVDGSSGMMSIRPAETRPVWATIPFLYALYRWSPGLIGGLNPRGANT